MFPGRILRINALRHDSWQTPYTVVPHVRCAGGGEQSPSLPRPKYGTPEIVNTGHGSQFTPEEFTSVVLSAAAKLPMHGRGAWRENVFVERLCRSVKYERVYLKAYDCVSAARADIADYLTWYNAQRAHSSLERLTPDEAYFAGVPALKLAARELYLPGSVCRRASCSSNRVLHWPSLT